MSGGETGVAPPEGNPYVEDPETDFAPVEELTGAEAAEQVEALREAIDFHDHRYYVAADPVIADRTYDALFERLEVLEEAFGLHDPNSPTQRVGAGPLDELETVPHVVEMLSLDAGDDPEEVREFDRRVREEVGEVTYTCEPKFDGLSIELVYEDGALDRAVTRGDGEAGEEVTANVRTIGSVPLRLQGDPPDELAVRGEIYFPKGAFHDLNEERIRRGEEPFANPRNAAAGTVRLLDPAAVADRPLAIFVFEVMTCSREHGTHREELAMLRSLGFRVPDRVAVTGAIDEFIAYRDALLEDRADLDWEVDGAIAKVDDLAVRQELGATARHPRWAFAYKFPPETGQTTVRKIVVQVGRTGKLTPVALMDPVDVQGVTITRATLHNASQVRELGAGVGATVKIHRAGDVIPYVDEVVEPGESVFEMPDACPVCGSEVVEEGEYHLCTGGDRCPAQLRGRLEHYGSREALDIEGLGEETVAMLVEEGRVEELADLYRLTVEDLVDLERFAERSARNLVSEIEASRSPDLASFLYALGIRHVGRDTARRLADAFSLDELLAADREQIAAIDGIGPIVADAVHGTVSGPGRATIEALREAGVEPVRQERSDELSGMTIVLTGSIPGYSRSELADLLEDHGARVTSSVSGSTDLLVVGEDPGQTKLDDAADHGVETLDVEAFRERVLARIDEA